jgi:L-asparaginase II
MIPGYVPLVVTTRGDVVENVHHGAAAVVDRGGRVLHAVGDPHALVFTRSTLKAFQALPFVLDGGPRALGLSDEQVALTTASHSGEPFHVAAVDALLARAGQPPEALQCGCHVPYVYETLGRAPPADARFDARHHNCSGKHAGFLAYCRLHGLSTHDYLEREHPLQRRIREQVGALLGLPAASLPVGTDGCSAPNLAMPLSGLARLWAMLAAGGAGAAVDPALEALFGAMTAHPEAVSGTGRSDLHFARAGRGDWVAKVGADGVQVVGVRSRGLGVALKIADGRSEARFVAAFAVLRALGLVAPDDPELSRYARLPIRNARGTVTGEMRAVFALAAVR